MKEHVLLAWSSFHPFCLGTSGGFQVQSILASSSECPKVYGLCSCKKGLKLNLALHQSVVSHFFARLIYLKLRVQAHSVHERGTKSALCSEPGATCP